MSFNHRLKAPWPTDDIQSKVLAKLAPEFSAEELAELLGLDNQKVARGAIDNLRKLSFNIENDPKKQTFRFHPVPKSS